MREIPLFSQQIIKINKTAKLFAYLQNNVYLCGEI